jgi:hypothetical protein
MGPGIIGASLKAAVSQCDCILFSLLNGLTRIFRSSCCYCIVSCFSFSFLFGEDVAAFILLTGSFLNVYV